MPQLIGKIMKPKKQEINKTLEATEGQQVRWYDFIGHAVLLVPPELKARMGEAIYEDFLAEIHNLEILMINKTGDQVFQVRLPITTLASAQLGEDVAMPTPTAPVTKPAAKDKAKSAKRVTGTGVTDAAAKTATKPARKKR
jgi:hypothetical protein